MRFFVVKLYFLMLPVIAAGNADFAQDVSFLPPAFNYTAHTYNAGNQNWSVAQSKDGVIYIANNDGLLSFDGVNWRLHEMPNKRGIKSIFIDSSFASEKIYVGSFEEFGYFEKDRTNQLSYHSLTPLLGNYEFMNDEIWTIHRFHDEIFFQSFSSYFIYHVQSGEIQSFKPNPGPLYFFSVNNGLYAQFIDGDFCRYTGSQFIPVLTREQLRGDVAVGVLPHGGNILLFLSKKGVLELDANDGNIIGWKTNADGVLNHTTINRVLQISDSIFAVGTLDNGLFTFDSGGAPGWHLNKYNGLNNNTVLGLFADRENNIWAALDNGISCIQAVSPISFYEPANIQIGMVEDILMDRNAFYLATNQGIYKYSGNTIQQLPGFEIQSWFIRKFGNQIITGHNGGTSFIENDRNKPIPESNTGGIDIDNARLQGKELLLQSTYTALQVYDNRNGRWEFSHKIDGFFDLISQIETDHSGNIWAAHMYKGIYRLRTDRAIRKIVEKEYFPTLDTARNMPGALRLMKLRGRIVFTDHRNFYTYNDITRQITPFGQLNADVPDLADTHHIVPVSDTVFWFIRNNEYTLVEFAGGHYSVREKIPFSTLNNPPNKGRGNVYVDDNGISYFSLNGGIGKYVALEKTPIPWQKLSLNNVLCSDRRKNTSRFLPMDHKNIIPYSDNNLTFEFQYPNYSRRKINVECYLEGYDSRWIPVEDTRLTAHYTNLPAGTYLLKARAFDEYANALSALTFSFQIKNPWYRTTWAFVIYFLLIAVFLLLLIRAYIKMVVKRKNNIFAAEEKERIAKLERQEKLIAELKNERLENELIYKSKELANASMLIINHEELLNKLKKEIHENIRAGNTNRFHGSNLIKMIESNILGEDEWALFQQNFDLIHENFFHKLKEKYSALTSTDLRLCALLRLNYSSKDIAKMLNLTLRGVEAARYRLRKKLMLTEEESLTSFMINFK